MHYDIGSTGQIILILFSIGFGAVAQLIVGKERGTPYLWLIGALAWFVGGVVASEVLVGTMTVEEIQPIIEGLAFDEALLGGLVTGVVAVAATWLLVRQQRHGTAPA
jgi:hypothetical protein